MNEVDILDWINDTLEDTRSLWALRPDYFEGRESALLDVKALLGGLVARRERAEAHGRLLKTVG